MSRLKLNYDSVAVSTATELGKKTAYDAFDTAFVCIRDGVTFNKNVTFTSGSIQFVKMSLSSDGALRYYTADNTSILVYKGFMWDNNLEVFEVYKDDKFRYIYDLSNAFTELGSTIDVDVLKLKNSYIDETTNDSRFLGDVAKVVTDINSVVTFETDFDAIKNYAASLPANTTSVIYEAVNVDEGGLIYPVGKVTKIEIQKKNSNAGVLWIGPDPEGLVDVKTLETWITNSSVNTETKRDVGQFTIASPSVESNLGTILNSPWSKIQETKISYLKVADLKLGQNTTRLYVYSSHPDNSPGVLTEDAFGFNNNTYLFNFTLGSYTGTFCSLTTTGNGKVYACRPNGSCVTLPNTLDDVRITEITPGPSLFDSSYFKQTSIVENGLHGESDIIASVDQLKSIVNDYYARQRRMISMSTPMFKTVEGMDQESAYGLTEGHAYFEIGNVTPGVYAVEIFDEIPQSGGYVPVSSNVFLISVPEYNDEFAYNTKATFTSVGGKTLKLFNTSLGAYQSGVWAVHYSDMPYTQDWQIKSDSVYDSYMGIRIHKI